MDGFEQTFTANIVMNCPVKFQDQPKRKWRIFQAFMIESSDGTDDPNKRTVINFGFCAYPCSRKKDKSSQIIRFIEIKKERTIRVEDLTDQSVTFVIKDNSNRERKITFLKRNCADFNFIYAT